MTSEVGTDLRAVRPCGGPCLRTLALWEKSPYLGGLRIGLGLLGLGL